MSARLKVGVIGNVTIGTDHQMARVVRIQVEYNVNMHPPGNDQTVLLAHQRGSTERTVITGICVARLVLSLEIGHAMRTPQSLPCVRSRHVRPEPDC